MYAAYDADMEPKTMGTVEFREQIAHRVDSAHFLHEPTIITRNGEPRAVLIPYSDWLAIQSGEGGPD